nr:hypothetical protein Itr_chr01CG08290 [Ipomoea trifida]
MVAEEASLETVAAARCHHRPRLPSSRLRINHCCSPMTPPCCPVLPLPSIAHGGSRGGRRTNEHHRRNRTRAATSPLAWFCLAYPNHSRP